METLRRAVLRGFLTGVFFGFVALVFLLIESESPQTKAWYVATIAFMTWFVATPQAALELVVARRPGGLRRDVFAGLAGLAVGVPLVIGAFSQWVYVVALVKSGDLQSALTEVRERVDDLFFPDLDGWRSGPRGWPLAVIFALPCGIVTFFRLRRTRWWLELPLSTGLTLVTGGALFRAAISWRIEGRILLVIGGAGFALSLGTRLGDTVAEWITSRLRDDEPRETPAGP